MEQSNHWVSVWGNAVSVAENRPERYAKDITIRYPIHVQQFLYHDFAVEEGTGAVLLGEVSQCNDDNTDNRFNPPVGRFPTIEEDEAPYRLLCNEYPAAK